MKNLPFITPKIPGIGGMLRKKTSHFVVEEIPLYEASGKGNHLYINFTKESMTTKDICSLFSKAVGISERDIGFAGLKDKHAVTTQTISFPIKKTDEKSVEEILDKIKSIPIRLNWAKLHQNKLKTGHLLGNRFIITISEIRNPENAYENCKKIVDEITKNGIPNYFGEQRFGIEGNNSEKGLKIIKGELAVKNKWLKKFLISSFQSDICNEYLARRVERGLFGKIIIGDIAKKYDTGGLFEVADIEKDNIRYNNKEISFTAPIYGYKMWEATGEAAKLEREILENSGITIDLLKKMKILGTRRLGRLLLNELEIMESEEGIILKFSLPKGAFATTVLREFMKSGKEDL